MDVVVIPPETTWKDTFVNLRALSMVRREIVNWNLVFDDSRQWYDVKRVILIGNKALSFGSGVAALGAIVLTLKKGDHIVSSHALYGGSTCLLNDSSRYGISVDYFTSTDVDEIIQLIKPSTKVKQLMLEYTQHYDQIIYLKI
jgi:hypothetical protein